jgi:hypothetical protein
MRRVPAALVAAGLLAAGLLAPGTVAGGAPLPGAGPDCPLFPSDNIWHADVSGLPVHPRSAAWITSMGGPDRRLHPDFGPNGGGQPYGIPYSVVPGSTEKVAVTFDDADESDPGPCPFGPATPIEGGSDAHALVVDKDRCVLYELFAADWNGGRAAAGSGAIWDLRSNALRPSGWTSADAAGLPILPGLLRRDEVAAGVVDHAIRLTAARSFDISRYRPDTQVVLRAMQRHGLVLADNGSNWYFTGTSEPGWDTGLLEQLKTIPAGAFEAAIQRRHRAKTRDFWGGSEEWVRTDVGKSDALTVKWTRFRRQAPRMHDDDHAGEALEDVARIHPALERLRDLLVSATALDLKASAKRYWADGREGERATISPCSSTKVPSGRSAQARKPRATSARSARVAMP